MGVPSPDPFGVTISVVGDRQSRIFYLVKRGRIVPFFPGDRLSIAEVTLVL
jgi:hypothetical protein